MANLPLLMFVLSLAAAAVESTARTRGVFYMAGDEGIYIVDPSTGKVDKTIGPEQVCTKNQRTGKICSFGGATTVRNELVVASDSPGNRVHLIDAHKQEVKETIATESYPYDVYYLPWKEEVWVHTWGKGTFDVISTKGRLERTHDAIKAHVKPGWTHGYMSANENMKDGNKAYVTHLWNPGLHQLDLGSKSYSDFVNVSSWNCTGTLHFAYSAVNQHGFFECMGPDVILELDTNSDKVVKKWNIPGYPFASPNGRYIVSLHAPVNETTNKLLTSKVNVLEVSKGSTPVQHPEIDIPGGVKDLVFVEKEDKESYFVFITLLYEDKIAVLDIDLVSSFDKGKVTYVLGVGRTKSGPGMHALSRPIAYGGDWVITPATLNNTAAVINVKTRQLHATVPGVPGANRIVWMVPKEPVTATGARLAHFNDMALVFLALTSVVLLYH